MTEAATFSSPEALSAMLENFKANIHQRVADVLLRFGAKIIDEAVSMTPVKSGVLRNSGTMEMPVIMSDGVSVTIFFDAKAKGYDYGERQHDDLTLHHFTGKAWFLFEPTSEAEDDIENAIADVIVDMLMEGGM